MPIWEPLPCLIKAGDSMLPRGSLGTRPVYPIAGCLLLLELLKPNAMSPALSIPMLAIQSEVLPDANVPCWKTTGVALGLRISYHRTLEGAVAPMTECVSTNVSCSLKLR